MRFTFSIYFFLLLFKPLCAQEKRVVQDFNVLNDVGFTFSNQVAKMDRNFTKMSQDYYRLNTYGKINGTILIGEYYKIEIYHGLILIKDSYIKPSWLKRDSETSVECVISFQVSKFSETNNGIT